MGYPPALTLAAALVAPYARNLPRTPEITNIYMTSGVDVPMDTQDWGLLGADQDVVHLGGESLLWVALLCMGECWHLDIGWSRVAGAGLGAAGGGPGRSAPGGWLFFGPVFLFIISKAMQPEKELGAAGVAGPIVSAGPAQHAVPGLAGLVNVRKNVGGGSFLAGYKRAYSDYSTFEVGAALAEDQRRSLFLICNEQDAL